MFFTPEMPEPEHDCIMIVSEDKFEAMNALAATMDCMVVTQEQAAEHMMENQMMKKP